MNQTLTNTRAGWHRHRWGRGWVEDTATVAQTAWIDAAAEVADCAVVEGHAWITDNARISGCAKVSDNATVAGWARVEGNAKVSGNAWLAADTFISDHAQVKDNAWIEGNIWIGEQATVGGNARLTDSVWVSGEALVEGRAWIAGGAWIEGHASVVSNRDYLHMMLLGYKMNAWRTKTNQIEVRYGCEMCPLDDWPRLLENFCKRYQPERAAQYQAAVSAFLEMAHHSISR